MRSWGCTESERDVVALLIMMDGLILHAACHMFFFMFPSRYCSSEKTCTPRERKSGEKRSRALKHLTDLSTYYG